MQTITMKQAMARYDVSSYCVRSRLKKYRIKPVKVVRRENHYKLVMVERAMSESTDKLTPADKRIDKYVERWIDVGGVVTAKNICRTICANRYQVDKRMMALCDDGGWEKIQVLCADGRVGYRRLEE